MATIIYDLLLEATACIHASFVFDHIEVREKLPKVFTKAKQMHQTEPLTIQQDAKVNDQCGFKAWLCGQRSLKIEVASSLCRLVFGWLSNVKRP